MIVLYNPADPRQHRIVESRVGEEPSWIERPIPAGYKADTWAWDPTALALVERPGLVEPLLIAAVKTEGERLKMQALTTGGGKKVAYNLQADEIKEYRSLFTPLVTTVTGVLALVAKLPLAEQRRKFGGAMDSAAIRGEPNIAKAIERFEAGADKSNSELHRLEAIEQLAVDTIKAATTAAGKRAAYAAINWAWKRT